MSRCLFKDNRREFIAPLILCILLCLIALIMSLFNVIFGDASYSFREHGPSTILFAALTLFLIGVIIQSSFCEVRIEGNKLISKSLSGSKEFILKEGILYSYKKYGRTKYYQFAITLDDASICITTKKPKEFVDQLLVYGAKLTDAPSA